MTHGLVAFELKPGGLKGEALFQHMAAYARRRTSGDKLRPSPYLDVEMSNIQETILDPSPHDLTCRELINDAGGDGATLKLAKRKLDASGNFKSISFLANAPERIRRLQQAATLAASMSEIKRADADEKKRKKVAASNDLVALAPAALKKLAAKGNDVSKITIAEIRSILLVCYKTQAPESIKKAKAVETLTKAIDADAAPLTQTIVAAPVAEVAAAAAPQPADAPDDDSSSDEE